MVAILQKLEESPRDLRGKLVIAAETSLVALSRSDRPGPRFPYNWYVRVVRNLCAVAVLCLWTSSPLLSCVLSFAQMNQEELACCKRMAGDCGAMNSSGHSCCK